MPVVGMPRLGPMSAGAKVATMRRRAKGSSRPECSQAASAWNALRSGKAPGMPRNLIFKVLASCRQHTARLSAGEQAHVESIRGRQAGRRTNEDRAYEAIQGGLARDEWRKAMAGRRAAEWDRLAAAPGRHAIRTAHEQSAADAHVSARAGRVAAASARYRDLRHRAAEAGRDLNQYLDRRGRVKAGVDRGKVQIALERFHKAVGRLSGDRSKAVSDAGQLIANVSKQVYGKSRPSTEKRSPTLTHSIDSPGRKRA